MADLTNGLKSLEDGSQIWRQLCNHNFSLIDKGFTLKGLIADRPLPGKEGRFYYATDENKTYYDNGSIWVVSSGGASGTGTVKDVKDNIETVSNAETIHFTDGISVTANGTTAEVSADITDIDNTNKDVTLSVANKKISGELPIQPLITPGVFANANVDVNSKGIITSVSEGVIIPNYSGAVVVAKSGGDFTDIQSAINSFTLGDRGVVKVMPGIYTGNITMQPFVDVISEGNFWDCVISGASPYTSPVVTMSDGCTLKGFTLTGSNVGGVYFAGASACTAEDIYVKDCKYGLHVNSSNARLYSNILAIDATSITCDKGIYAELGTVISQDYLTVPSSTITSHLYAKDGNILAFEFAPNVGAVNGSYVNGNGNIDVHSGSMPICTNALRVGINGGSLSTYSLHTEIGNNFDLLVESVNGIVNAVNTYIREDLVDVIYGADVKYTSYDDLTGRFTNNIDFQIGSHKSPRSFYSGYGGSYQTRDVKVFSYDGSNFVDETSSDPIDFPNNNVNTALYFGDIDGNNKFYGMSLIMGATNLIGGSYVWEYFDGGANGGLGAWVAFDVSSNLNGYSDYYGNVFFEESNPNEVISIRFDKNIETGVKENDENSSGWISTTINGINCFWIRCRITSTITTSMQFSSVRLKSNYTSIRKNGTISYHGNARVLNDLPTQRESSESTANYNIGYSPNISYPGLENKFATTANDTKYFRATLPEDIDTSCGIYFEFDWFGTSNVNSNNIHPNIKIYCCLAKIGDNCDNNTLQEQQFFNDLLMNNPYSKGEKIKTILPKRINIANYQPGDLMIIKFNRNGGTGSDNYTGNFILCNIRIQYTKWQNGSHYK